MSEIQVPDTVNFTWRPSAPNDDQPERKGRAAAHAVLAAGGSPADAYKALLAAMSGSSINGLIVTINGEQFGA